MHTRSALAIVALWLSLAPSSRAALYNLTDLGSLGGDKGSGGYAFSAGIAAGYSFVPGSGYVHAMINDRGTVLDLGTLGGTQSLARGVNSSGDVVGWAYPPGFSWQRAFLWHAGSMIDLGTFGGTTSDAHGINDDGLVVGSAFTSDGNERPFWWRNGVMHEMGTLGGTGGRALSVNGAGDIVGWSSTPEDEEIHAFLSKPGSPLYDLGTLGGPASYAWSINDRLHVCGWSYLQANSPASRGFIWADGIMKSVGTLGGIYSSAFGMNNSDEIVGNSTRADEVQVAFLWRQDEIVDLNSLLPPGTNWLLTEAYSIDDDDVIVGVGKRPDGSTRAYMLTPAATTSVPGSGATLRFAGATPNPVQGKARFAFELPVAGRAELVLHDLSGRIVRELATGWYGAGPQSIAWDGRDAAGNALAPGAYFARLTTPHGVLMRRFVVLH